MTTTEMDTDTEAEAGPGWASVREAAEKRLVLFVLRQAASLVAKGWCQGVMARGEAGNPVGAVSARARAWCADGAVYRAARDLRVSQDVERAARLALQRGLPEPLPLWNDAAGRTQAEVAGHIAAAIARLEGDDGLY